ncbi:hypothetical protein [Nocardia sp. CNY236]|uniref:hypothetical protein n=1 Tax=Nocardia sp. CNY236 TaxID=1169152 RepID=UPI00040A2BB9|nr:hypothetical protein [Nocardia sp. CNY236]
MGHAAIFPRVFGRVALVPPRTARRPEPPRSPRNPDPTTPDAERRRPDIHSESYPLASLFDPGHAQRTGDRIGQD